MKSSLFLKLGLIVQGLIKLMYVICCLLQLSLLSHAPISMSEAQANDHRMKAVATAALISFVLMLLAYYVWIFSAKKESVRLGAAGLAYSPGLSVGCHFIPIGSLFMPYFAMQELNQTSLDPLNWNTQRKSDLVVFWWISWVVATLAGFVPFVFLTSGRGLDHLRTYTWLLIGVGALYLVSYALLFLVVKKISRQIQSSRLSQPPVIPT